MEKLKNLLNPGAKHDDEILYGSGTISDPVHSGKTEDARGEGSRFASARGTPDTNVTKTTAPSDTPVSSDFTGGNSSDTRTEAHPPVTAPLGSTGGSSSQEDNATFSDSLPATSSNLQTNPNSVMPGTFNNDASSTTAIRGGVPGDSHVTNPTPGSESIKTSLTNPRFKATRFSAERDAEKDGTSIAANEAARAQGTHHVPDNRGVGRAFPLSGSNAPSSADGLHSKISPEYRQTTNDSRAVSSGNVDPALQTYVPKAQNMASDLGNNSTKDAELGSYGPESWQHEHNKHGHEFVPVKQHETIMGALLDPHSSGTARDAMTEPQSHLKEETAVGGAAFAGAGAAWERNQGHPLPSGTGQSSTAHADEEHKPASAMAAKAARGEPATAGPQGYSSAETPTAVTDAAPDSTGTGLSGPVHKSSLLNKLDPRVKEASPKTADTISLDHPQTSAPSSSTLPYSSSQLDPRIDAEPRKNVSAPQHPTGRDMADAGALGGTSLAGADYAREGDHHNANSEHESTSHTQHRGFMGVGDTGFDHDRAELNPQRTSFAPPYAATQAFRKTPETRQAEPSSAGEEEHTPEHHYGRDATIAGTGAAFADGINSHHNQVESNSGFQPTDQSYDNNLSQESRHHYARDAGLVGTGAAAGEALESYPQAEPVPASQPMDYTLGKEANRDHHYGRDAAVVGTGALAAEEIHQREGKSPAEFSKQEAERASKQEVEHMKALDKQREQEAKALDKEHKKEEKLIAAEQKKEDKAIAQQEKAAAKEQKEHEKEVKALEKEHKQEEKAAAKEQKEHKKEVKALEKEHKQEENKREEEAAAVAEKEHADHDKYSTKEEKRHEKLHAALDKAQTREEKQFEKAQKERENESNEPHSEKKQRGILGLFHRDKKSRQEAGEDSGNRDHSSFGLSSAKPAEAGVVAPSAHEITDDERGQHEKYERNRLHKDPPASLLPTAGNTTYAEAPKSGYAAQVTGGTRTTALAQGDDFRRGSHISAIGNKLDPAVDASGLTTSNEQNTIIDSRTSVPVGLSNSPHGHGTDDTPMPQGGIFSSSQATAVPGRASQAAAEEIGTAR